MYRILPIFLIPLLVMVLALEGSYLIAGKTRIPARIPLLMLPNLKPTAYLITVFGGLAAGQIIVYLLLDLFIRFCTAGAERGVPGIVLLFVSLCWSGYAFLQIWGTKRSIRKLSGQLAAVCAALLVLEIGVFNGKSLGKIEKEKVELGNVRVLNDTDFKRVNGITVYENGTLLIRQVPEFTRVVQVEVSQPERQRVLRVQVSFTDDNFKERFNVGADHYVTGQSDAYTFSLIPYGSIREINLDVWDIHEWAAVRSITLLNKVPFSFSALRFLILLAICGAFLTIKATGFNRVIYDRTSRSHRIAVAVMTCLCVAANFLFVIPGEKMIAYPLEEGVINISDPYIQTFDALEHGRAWIDIPVDPKLDTLENVYDNEERISSGIPAAWDRAYYNGKYYSYFGITPVLTVYYPCWFIFGKLPTLQQAILPYSLLSTVFVILLLLALVRLFVRKPNFLGLLLLIPAVAAVCGSYYYMDFPSIYTVPFAAGLCFLVMCLYFGVQAVIAKQPKLRLMLLAGCGLALGLCVGARPSMALCSLVLAPLFIAILMDKQFSVQSRISQAAAFLIPTAVCAAGVMYWNYIRFDSPFDFGAAYQLTVSDIHANQPRLSLIFAGLFQNLLQPLELINQFPFLHIRAYYSANYGMYSYAEGNFGALWIPMLSAGLFLLPQSLRTKGDTLQRVRLRGFLVLGVALSCIIAWMDLCMGGTTTRYLFDFIPLLTMCSAVVLLRNLRHGQGFRYRSVLLIVLATFFFLLILVWAEGNVIIHNHPGLYDYAEDLLIFWS